MQEIILDYQSENITIKYSNLFPIKSTYNLIAKLLFVINFGIILSWVGLLIISIINDYYWRADFTAFYTGGALIRDSHGSQLYDLELQTTYQKEILQSNSFQDGVLPFNYPPYVAFLFLPLSYFPLKTAYYIWLLFQVILTVILIKQLIKISSFCEMNERNYLIVSSLALPYVLITLLLGTFSLLMLIAVIQFYFSYKSGHLITAGLWLSILALKPQILVIPIIIILSSKKWNTVITSILIGLFLFTMTGLLLGWNIWIDFLERLSLSSTYFDEFGIYPGAMHNLKGLLTSIFGGYQANFINAISFIVFILMLLFVFLLWSGNLDPYSPRFDLLYSLSISLGLLFSPHLNPQDSIILIAPMAIFLNIQNFLDINRRHYTIFMLGIPLISWLSDFWIKDSLYVRPTILITIILCAWIYHSYYKTRKQSNQGLLNFKI